MPGQTGEPPVGVIVVTWNGLETSRRCLTSLRTSDYPAFDVCLVDNGSRHSLRESIAREFPEANVLSQAANRGYAAGCNAGLAWARERGLTYALLLNDDTTVDPRMIRELVSSAERSEGPQIIAPMILISSQPDVVWSSGGRIRRPWLKADHIGRGQDRSLHQSPADVEWASGCALFFPLSVLDTVGLLDEEYFLYLEDVAWCLRARKKGVPVHYEPRARMWHEVSAAVSTIDKRHLRYYTYRNYYRLAFAQAGVPGRAWFSLHLAATLLKTAVRWTFFPAYRHDSFYHARTRGILDFLRGRFGRAPYPDEPEIVSSQAPELKVAG